MRSPACALSHISLTAFHPQASRPQHQLLFLRTPAPPLQASPPQPKLSRLHALLLHHNPLAQVVVTQKKWFTELQLNDAVEGYPWPEEVRMPRIAVKDLKATAVSELIVRLKLCVCPHNSEP